MEKFKRYSRLPSVSWNSKTHLSSEIRLWNHSVNLIFRGHQYNSDMWVVRIRVAAFIMVFWLLTCFCVASVGRKVGETSLACISYFYLLHTRALKVDGHSSGKFWVQNFNSCLGSLASPCLAYICTEIVSVVCQVHVLSCCPRHESSWQPILQFQHVKERSHQVVMQQYLDGLSAEEREKCLKEYNLDEK